MQMMPSLRSTRIEKLEPGDLFIMHHSTGSYYALAVKDLPITDKVALLLGPPAPNGLKVPILTDISQRLPVVSFAKNYRLSLPFAASAWLATEPPEGPCIVLVEDSVYLRARFGYGGQTTQCYVGIKDGVIVADDNGNLAHPRGNCAYTSNWGFLTDEKDAREILSSHAQ